MTISSETNDHINVEFDQTINDMVDFQLFNSANNPLIQRQLFIFRLGKSIFALLFLGVFFYLTHGRFTVLTVSIAVLTAIAVFTFDPGSQKRATVRRVMNLYSDPKNKHLLGRHYISLSPGGIFVKNQLGESKFEWRAIDRVMQSKQSYFLYVNPHNAIVIPKSSIPASHEQQEFTDYLSAHIRHE